MWYRCASHTLTRFFPALSRLAVFRAECGSRREAGSLVCRTVAHRCGHQPFPHGGLRTGQPRPGGSGCSRLCGRPPVHAPHMALSWRTDYRQRHGVHAPARVSDSTGATGPWLGSSAALLTGWPALCLILGRWTVRLRPAGKQLSDPGRPVREAGPSPRLAEEGLPSA